MKKHENILVFGPRKHTYNPIMTDGRTYTHTGSKKIYSGLYTANGMTKPSKSKQRYPHTILSVEEPDLRHDTLNGHVSQRMHPTQKPVALLEWLIKTYTNSGDTVLDPVFGSCTTGIACLRNGRNFVGIEKDATYFEVGRKRMAEEQARLMFQVTV